MRDQGNSTLSVDVRSNDRGSDAVDPEPIRLSCESDALDSLLKCPVCRGVFVDPTMAMPCGHCFCAKCLAGCRTNSDRCPVCRSILGDTSVKQYHLVQLLDLTCVRCSCGKEFPKVDENEHVKVCPRATTCPDCGTYRCWRPDAIEEHRTRFCSETRVVCPDCSDAHPRSKLSDHECRGAECCGRRWDRERLDRHRRFECLSREVECPSGCGASFPASELESHRSVCELVYCPECDECHRRAERHDCPEKFVPCCGCGGFVKRKHLVAHRRFYHGEPLPCRKFDLRGARWSRVLSAFAGSSRNDVRVRLLLDAPSTGAEALASRFLSLEKVVGVQVRHAALDVVVSFRQTNDSTVVVRLRSSREGEFLDGIVEDAACILGSSDLLISCRLFGDSEFDLQLRNQDGSPELAEVVLARAIPDCRPEDEDDSLQETEEFEMML